MSISIIVQRVPGDFDDEEIENMWKAISPPDENKAEPHNQSSTPANCPGLNPETKVEGQIQPNAVQDTGPDIPDSQGPSHTAQRRNTDGSAGEISRGGDNIATRAVESHPRRGNSHIYDYGRRILRSLEASGIDTTILHHYLDDVSGPVTDLRSKSSDLGPGVSILAMKTERMVARLENKIRRATENSDNGEQSKGSDSRPYESQVPSSLTHAPSRRPPAFGVAEGLRTVISKRDFDDISPTTGDHVPFLKAPTATSSHVNDPDGIHDNVATTKQFGRTQSRRRRALEKIGVPKWHRSMEDHLANVSAPSAGLSAVAFASGTNTAALFPLRISPCASMGSIEEGDSAVNEHSD